MNVPDSLFTLAYGPFPGIELVPYFLGLMAWAVLAFFAVLISPITALLRRLRGSKQTSAPRPESSGESREPSGE